MVAASRLEPLTGEGQLETLVQASHERPVVIFKHSISCGTSAYAFDQLQDHLAAVPAGADDLTSARYAVVVVQTHRPVSTAIAARFGVRHETPQVLLLRDGRVVWHASHYRVGAEAIAQALGTHARAAAPARP